MAGKLSRFIIADVKVFVVHRQKYSSIGHWKLIECYLFLKPIQMYRIDVILYVEIYIEENFSVTIYFAFDLGYLTNEK